MTLRLVPHEVGTRRADIWLGSFGRTGRPAAGTLRCAGRTLPIPSEAWQAADAGGWLREDQRDVWVQTLPLPDLQPGTDHTILAEVGGRIATGSFATLPERLPAFPSPPFVVLLGSCFAEFQPTSRRVGRNVLALPIRPHIKLLMGDQVYLDNPLWPRPPADSHELAAFLLGKYRKTWTQDGDSGDPTDGFSALLARGGTWFLADDHEFWNNHPNWTPLLPTVLAGRKDTWAKIALSLWRTFQCARGVDKSLVQSIEIGPLRVALVDTRIQREEGSERFTTDDALRDLVRWIEEGEPGTIGMIVLGPTLFTKSAGRLGSRFEDRSLANYRQYASLADAILASPRSLLVLAGDVHFGRVATARLASGAQLVEIVSSPLSLVSRLLGFLPSNRDAPPRFPVRAGRRPAVDVSTEYWIDGGRARTFADEHLSTLELWQTDQSVKLRLRAWQLGETGPRERGSWVQTLLLEAP